MLRLDRDSRFHLLGDLDSTSKHLYWSCFLHPLHPDRLQQPRKGPALAPEAMGMAVFHNELVRPTNGRRTPIVEACPTTLPEADGRIEEDYGRFRQLFGPKSLDRTSLRL